jgi:predicted protein tyrosine phosphatase
VITPPPIRFTVCGFAELERSRGAVSASYVLSLLDPGIPLPAPLTAFPESSRLELRFDDVIEVSPQTRPPTAVDVEAILALGRRLTSDLTDCHLLIHCHAGFSRSPAALALLLAQAQPSLPPSGIADEVLRIRPNAWPNFRIIELGDRALDKRGNLMTAAAEVYRRRLDQDPKLAELMQKNNRLREVKAGRNCYF